MCSNTVDYKETESQLLPNIQYRKQKLGRLGLAENWNYLWHNHYGLDIPTLSNLEKRDYYNNNKEKLNP